MGGGVALYVHKSVDFKRCDDLIKSDIEAISAKIKMDNYKPFLVTSIYRPPGKPVAYFHDIELLVRDIDNQIIESIIMGDTNCNFMDKSNSDTKNLLKIMNTYNLKQVINDYTRVTGTTKTCIDHIMTNRPDCVFKSGVINCGISDHDSVYMIKNLRVPTPKLPPRTLSVRNFKKFDLKSFRKELMEVPFDDQIKHVTNDANEMWLIWKAFFLDLLNKHAPITNIKFRNNKLPYATSELRKLIRQRDYLRAKANKTGLEYIRQAFNHLRSKVSYELNHAEKNYYTCKIEQHTDKLKLAWNVLKHAIGEGGSSISATENLELGDDIISDSKKISEICNDHFVTVGERLADQMRCSDYSSTVHIPKTNSVFQLKPLTEGQVLKLLNKLINGKATGLHNIPNRVLKESADIIGPSLTFIFNFSIMSRAFPDDLKMAQVTPAFKGGDRDDLGNYRPISVLPIVARIFEKLV